MKASEVLKRYAEGRRNFRGENLRGLSFKGKDLSGADFSEADIRGTNFRDAILRGTKFNNAKAGLQKRWVIVLLMVCLLLMVFSGLLCRFIGSIIAESLVSNSMNYRVVGWVNLVVLVWFCIFIIRLEIGSNFAIAFAYTITFAFTYAIVIAITYAITYTITYTITYAFAVAFAIAIAIAIAITYAIAFAYTIAITIAMAITYAVITYSEVSNLSLQAGIIAGSITLILGLLSAYIGLQAIKGNKKYTFIRGNAVAIAATGGTCFRDADLTDADFTAALLKNTNLKAKTLIRTCWKNSKKLDLARVGDTILSEYKVRELLVTGKGQHQSFEKANLRGTNLTDADLSYANLKQANLSQAILQGANLEGAILTETNCVGTDFTQATLTAARLEAWNIDSTTILEQVNCDYVFLLEKPNAKGSLERRPHDPDAVFQPGDFEKLYRQIMNTVEILLRNGMNSDAFRQAFNQLIGEHPEIDYDSIQSIEKKGNDVLVTLEVSEETDKGQVERQFLEVYEARLEAAKQTALLEAEVRHNQDLTQIIHQALLERSPNSTVNLNNTIQQETKTMSDNQDINTRDVQGNLAGSVGRDFDASGAILNIDNVNSSVSNSINQLPPTTEPEKPGIKELLEQLQNAISNSSDLDEDAKVEALEQVKTLAEAGQKPENGEMQKKAKRAMGFLKVILDELPTVTNLVQKCQEILPAITTFFGLG